MKFKTIIVVLILCTAGSVFAQGPAWWFDRGVVDPNLPSNDYALITQGQLKWLATNACDEMEAYFGAGTGVTALVGTFLNTNNYYPANIGQLKFVAQPFYDRLYDLNLTNTFPSNMPGYYPWGNLPATNDFALANIGQAKYVFSFDSTVDYDGDGLPDWWEVAHGLDPKVANQIAFDCSEDTVWWESGSNYNAFAHLATNSVNTGLVWTIETLEGGEITDITNGVFNYSIMGGGQYKVIVNAGGFTACSATTVVNVVYVDLFELDPFVKRDQVGIPWWYATDTLYRAENSVGQLTMNMESSWTPNTVTGMMWRIVSLDEAGAETNWSATMGTWDPSPEVAWTGGEGITNRHYAVWMGRDLNDNGILETNECKINLYVTPTRVSMSPLTFVPRGVTNEFVFNVEPAMMVYMSMGLYNGAAGSAVFGNGSNYMSISSGCETVKVCGVENSSEMSNMLFCAGLAPSPFILATYHFTVGEITNLTVAYEGNTNLFSLISTNGDPVSLPVPNGGEVTFTAQTEPTALAANFQWSCTGANQTNGSGATFSTTFSGSGQMGIGLTNGGGGGGYNFSIGPLVSLVDIQVQPPTILVSKFSEAQIIVNTAPAGYSNMVAKWGNGYPLQNTAGTYTIYARIGNTSNSTTYKVVNDTNQPSNELYFDLSVNDECGSSILVAKSNGVEVEATWGIIGANPGGVKLTTISNGKKARLEGEGTVELEVSANGKTIYATVSVFLQSCASGNCAWGATVTKLRSLDVVVSLGHASDGSKAGMLCLKSDSNNMTFVLSTPFALSCVAKPEVEIIRTNAEIRQVRASEGLFDVVTNNDFAYEIRLYPSSNVCAKGGDGLYGVTNDPVKIIEICNPDTTNACDRLWVTELTAVSSNRTEYAYEATNLTWEMVKGDGLYKETLANEDLGGGRRFEERKVLDAGSVVFGRTETVFRQFDWGEEVEERRVDSGSGMLVTSNEYYTNPADEGKYGRVYRVHNPDGDWAEYDYNTNGLETSASKSWKDSFSPPDNARAEYRDFTPVDGSDDGTERPWQPRRIIEKVCNVEVSRTYYACYKVGEESVQVEERCGAPGAGYGASGNLRTVTVYYPTNASDGAADQVKSVTYPDGRYDYSEFEQGSYYYDSGNPANSQFSANEVSNAVRRSTLHASTNNPSGIVNRSLKEVEVLENGRSVLQETYILKAPQEYERIQFTVRVYDDLGHVTAEFHSDGRQTETQWGCCGRDSEKDAQGVEREYFYDGLNRLEQMVQAGVAAGDYPAQADVSVSNTYDVVGRLLTETRSAGGLAEVVSNSYDLAGRLLSKTDAAGLTTTYTYISENPKRVQENLPGGGTRVTEYYKDGQLKSVTGTVQTAVFYDYGAEDGTQWTKESQGSADSPCWTKTTTDCLGRTIKVEKPGFSGTETNEYFYNSKGQLIRQTAPDGQQTLFEYDELGQQTRSGLDIDSNETLAPAGMDRITDSEISYEQISGVWYRTLISKIFATDNSATPITNSITREQLTGLSGGTRSVVSVLDAYGNETITTTTVDRDNKKVTQTVDVPDSSSNVVMIAVNGLVQSQTGKGGTATTFGYDALGRRTTVTDARLDSAVTHYDSHGWVDYIEDAENRQTTFTYESSTGRKISQTDALTNTIRYAYTMAGQLEKTWGAIYPVWYEYDAYGHMTKMHTYRSGEGFDGESWPSGAGEGDVTTWTYQEASGLLTNKQDAAGQSVSYAYASGGKLASRTWSRTSGGNALVTTYSYDAAGSITNIDYSDSTPDVSFTCDRLGRQTVAESSVSHHEFTYSGLNLASESIIRGGATNVITRSTDNLGRPSGFSLDSDYQVAYGFDTLGRFNQISNFQCQVSYSYLANSDLISQQSGANGPTISRTYEDHRNLITQIKNEFGTNLISRFDYQSDAGGRRTQRIDFGVATNDFGYNAKSELTSAAMGTNAFAYSYDPIGNRIWSAANAESNDYTANSLNQYASIQSTDNGSLVTGEVTCAGGFIMTNGGYIIHTFTNVGTTNFVVSGGSLICDVLVVAGGGGGGANFAGGGGGGGVIYTTAYTVVEGANTVTVGEKGTGGPAASTAGTDGSNSVFGSFIGYGGGVGGYVGGNSGGSGGGGAPGGTGGTGTNGQGYAGGAGPADVSNLCAAGGGGGATAQGADGNIGTGIPRGGNGGEGFSCSISGAAHVYGSGGGGGALNYNSGGDSDINYGLGGTGAGNGGVCDYTTPERMPSAATYYGCGGGGGGWNGTSPDSLPGANGFQGIVIARYYPTAVTNHPTTFSALAYDADGNCTNNGAWVYSWDAENRMISAEPISPTNGSSKVEFQYDYMSRRVSKAVSTWDGSTWVGQSTNRFIYDGWNLISEICNTESQITTNFYVWGLDLSGTIQGAGGIGGLLSATFNGTNTVLYCFDANGNVTDLVGTNGSSVASYQYDPYGKVISSSGAMAGSNPIRFSTKYWDDETGLGFWGRRYYHPEEGRWISRDPIEEMGGANLYGFVLNSPIATADPFGLYTLFFNPWWSWSHQEIDQVANTFYSLYAVIGRANSLVDQRLSLLDKQPNSCPFKRPLIQQYKFAQGVLNGIQQGLGSSMPWIGVERNRNPKNEASTSGGGWFAWRILLSNLSSQNDVLHELAHHYGTTTSADSGTLYNDDLFGNFASGRGVGPILTAEASAKQKYGDKTCCPMPLP